MPRVMITANCIYDGVVVWLTREFAWSEDSSLAAGFAGDAAIAARHEVRAATRRNEIVAAYEIKIDGREDRSMRERIRAGKGPTILPPSDRPQTPAAEEHVEGR